MVNRKLFLLFLFLYFAGLLLFHRLIDRFFDVFDFFLRTLHNNKFFYKAKSQEDLNSKIVLRLVFGCCQTPPGCFNGAPSFQFINQANLSLS